MKKEDLFEALGDIDEQLVAEAETWPSQKRRPVWLKWGAAAACLCVVIALALFLPMPEAGTPADTPQDGAPSVTIDGRTYTVSPHLTSITASQPEGFVLGGILEGGIYDGREYYVNPDIPTWVYVRYETVYDGTAVDPETGAMLQTEPRMTYTRYVDERIRGKDFVSYDDRLYISLWSASYWSDSPDVSQERYDTLKERWGLCFEADAVAGFTSAGRAEFSGDDTVPAGKLACNKGAPEILVSPEHPEVVLVETSWYTSTPEEGRQTRHTGWDVYILAEAEYPR